MTAYNILKCQLICERPLRYKSIVIKDIFIHALIKIEIKITYIHKCLNKNRNQDHIYTSASILNSSVMVLDLSYSDQFNRKWCKWISVLKIFIKCRLIYEWPRLAHSWAQWGSWWLKNKSVGRGKIFKTLTICKSLNKKITEFNQP